MSNKDLVERDLREYLAQADNMRNEDKMNYLRALFDKHFIFRKVGHLMGRSDLFMILSDAKSKFTKQQVRPNISGKPVDNCDLTNLSVIEAFIMYLSRNGLLNKHVEFDYTSEAEEYEGISDL